MDVPVDGYLKRPSPCLCCALEAYGKPYAKSAMLHAPMHQLAQSEVNAEVEPLTLKDAERAHIVKLLREVTV